MLVFALMWMVRSPMIQMIPIRRQTRCRTRCRAAQNLFLSRFSAIWRLPENGYRCKILSVTFICFNATAFTPTGAHDCKDRLMVSRLH